MSKNITVIKADMSHSDGIKRLIRDAYMPIRERNIQKFGPEIAAGLDIRWQMPNYDTPAEKDEILVAAIDGKVVGFTAYRISGDMLITDYTVSDGDVSEGLYTATVETARDNGCKYARIHTVTDGIYDGLYGNYRKVGYKTGLEAIMYYMPLCGRPQRKINSEVVIAPASEEHIKEVEKITVAAWTPIRLEQKRLLGDRLYTRLFDGWEQRKCQEVKNDFLAKGKGGAYGYAALIDGKVAGFVTRLKNPTAPYMGIVGNNAVNPEFAGKGIGSAMYNYIFDEMEKDGMTHVGVYTGRDNAHAPARRAYEKVGFSPDCAVCCADYYMTVE